MRASSALVGLAATVVTTVAAAESPHACQAYERSREAVVKAHERAAEGKTRQTLMGRYSPADQADEAAAIARTSDGLARLCLGELAGAGRFAEAAQIAAKAGYFDEALKLTELAKQAAQPR